MHVHVQGQRGAEPLDHRDAPGLPLAAVQTTNPVPSPGARPAPRAGQSVAEDAATWFHGRPLAEVSRFYDTHYLEHVHHVHVDPDARDVLRLLADQAVPTAIVTNTPQPLAGRITARLGLNARTVVGENDVPRAKPAPHMLWLAAARLGCPPASALMVGDSTYDQRAAHAAGVPFVHVHPAGAALPGARSVRSLREVVALAAKAASAV